MQPLGWCLETEEPGRLSDHWIALAVHRDGVSSRLGTGRFASQTLTSQLVAAADGQHGSAAHARSLQADAFDREYVEVFDPKKKRARKTRPSSTIRDNLRSYLHQLPIRSQKPRIRFFIGRPLSEADSADERTLTLMKLVSNSLTISANRAVEVTGLAGKTSLLVFYLRGRRIRRRGDAGRR